MAVLLSTKGLLLVDVNRSLALELTSEDCAWRQRIGQGGEWHKVKPVLLTSEDNATSFNVSDVRKLSGDDLLGATIILNMNSKHGLQPVARLVSQCKPGVHMDFKLNGTHPSFPAWWCQCSSASLKKNKHKVVRNNTCLFDHPLSPATKSTVH